MKNISKSKNGDRMMHLIDYTGKLNNHEEYIKILKKLKSKCNYIEIVILDGKESNELVDRCSVDILKTKKVSKWWGTKTRSVNNLYKIKASNKLFGFLEKYETFCEYYEYGSNEESIRRRSDYSEITDFGIDDIAFYDENNNYLLFTTTHEGYITISDELI